MDYPLTDRQKEALEIAAIYPDRQEAADVFGTSLRNFQRTLTVARRKNVIVPDGSRKFLKPNYKMGKVTTHVQYKDDDGQIKNEWIRQHPDYKGWEKAIAELCDKLPVAKPVKAPLMGNKELLTLYTITDFHMGMLSFAPETGANWDTDIATRVLTNAIAEMIERSPDSEVGVFAQLGDFLHFDSLDSITPSSGHLLDSDTRYDRLVRCAIHSICNAIDMLLKKHKKVIVIMAEGNHDMAGSVWLRCSMERIYQDNPRVTIDDTSFPFYAYAHGDIMLAWHHGHKVKNKSLPALFSSEPRYRQMYGNAIYTYIHTGHTHQKEKDASEYGGAIVERHQTLTARDSYATRGGWVSQRAANAITYHSKKGEYSRVTVYPDMA